jgi:hypothetical protein
VDAASSTPQNFWIREISIDFLPPVGRPFRKQYLQQRSMTADTAPKILIKIRRI